MIKGLEDDMKRYEKEEDNGKSLGEPGFTQAGEEMTKWVGKFITVFHFSDFLEMYREEARNIS